MTTKSPKRNAKTNQRNSSKIDHVLDECNSEMIKHGSSQNLIARNNLLISIIRKELGNTISISTEGHVDNDVYHQHSLIKDLSSETVVAEHKMSESQKNLETLANYLDIPSIPSIVIESVSLAQALNIFGCSGSTITPAVATSDSIVISAPTTDEKTPAEEPKSQISEKDIVISTSIAETNIQPKQKEEVSETTVAHVVESQQVDIEDIIVENETATDPEPQSNVDIVVPEEQEDIIVPITSARKLTDTSSLEISKPVEPMFEMISESSIRKFFAIMQKLDISEETVLSFLNIKDGSGEPVPTSVATMTKGQGYRVLNRLKQAEKNHEPMVKLLEARRAEFGNFSSVREAANSSLFEKKK
ncbi:hypothetical protein [Photobacterium damselae]|uniref:hypothetical protein n=1 Tax=Photobacterium damselae TaxID=38293 RepID=UPI001F183C0D|nr:hypothetical protein [Photobacterium damselae]UKA04645.1 hypothetical protein IHC89_23790 [Photobacterium damselae subsp. damselae]